jgi:sulfhydrogenase subunit beta (sulfur reductase)
MSYAILQKENLNRFVIGLAEKSQVVAPIYQGYHSYAFEKVRTAERIAVTYIPTILPPKKYYAPQHETLLEYDVSSGLKAEAVVEYEPLVLFGVHTCDLAGIQCLNVVFSDRPKDLNYLFRKNKIVTIGLECNVYCDEYASCALMGNHLPKGGYDLFFTDLTDYFLIHVLTQTGDQIREKMGSLFEEAGASHLKDLEALRERKRIIFHNEVDVRRENIPILFDQGFDHPVWEEIGNRCLSCGNCTNVCPTCYCFDVMDIPNLDLKTGKRIRVWDSCQNEPFAKVASGESFRAKRSDRKRHRFYRKFKYHNDRFARFYCTGCGRCSRTCMARINLKETIAALGGVPYEQGKSHYQTSGL